MEAKVVTILEVHCVDPRYADPAVMQYLSKELSDKAYIWTCAGASLGLQNERIRQALFDDARTLKAAGAPLDTIRIIDHFGAHGSHGCKAYGEDDSRRRHEANLRQAAELIRSEPGFESFGIALFLHDIDAGVLEAIPVTQAEPVAA